MALFAMLHGSGEGGWAWHLVQRALVQRGHGAVAPDLPTDRDEATWEDCVQVVLDAVGGARDVVVVGQSAGGFVVPLVAERLDARLQVFVAGMVPQPGETAADWFGNVGWSDDVARQAAEDGGLTGDPDPQVEFFHDVPTELAQEAMARQRPTADRLAETPWPLPALPDIEARYVVTTHDRFLPPPVQRRVAAVRLGIADPAEIATGHCPHLSRPAELAGLLAGFVA